MRIRANRPQTQEGEAAPEAAKRRLTDAPRRGILLDFDHTLFDTDRFFWVDLKSAFARFGVPDDAWEKSYEAIWPTGYSLAKHLDELNRLGALTDPFATKGMLAALESTFSDLRPYVFPDVSGFLDAARQMGCDLILLSFGDAAWQSYKVRASGLTPYFKKVVYTPNEGAKTEFLDALGLAYAQLYAVDNNPAELDAMKAKSPRLQTYLICRVEPCALEGPSTLVRDRFREAARYLTIPSRLPHQRCRSLNEVAFSWPN